MTRANIVHPCINMGIETLSSGSSRNDTSSKSGFLMLRLRCYVFGNLVRESESRELSREELQFLENHRTECDSCRQREAISNCNLDDVRSRDAEEDSDVSPSTRSILDNLGFNIT